MSHIAKKEKVNYEENVIINKTDFFYNSFDCYAYSFL